MNNERKLFMVFAFVVGIITLVFVSNYIIGIEMAHLEKKELLSKPKDISKKSIESSQKGTSVKKKSLKGKKGKGVSSKKPSDSALSSEGVQKK